MKRYNKLKTSCVCFNLIPIGTRFRRTISCYYPPKRDKKGNVVPKNAKHHTFKCAQILEKVSSSYARDTTSCEYVAIDTMSFVETLKAVKLRVMLI